MAVFPIQTKVPKICFFPICLWGKRNITSIRNELFTPLTCKNIYGILFLDKNRNYLKANLLKGRDAKPEGAKVRKFDQVSRLPLFPYHHIGKDVRTEEISDNFYTIWMCDSKEI